MARTFVEEFGRLLKETRDMEGMFSVVAAIVLRRATGRVCVSSSWSKDVDFGS